MQASCRRCLSDLRRAVRLCGQETGPGLLTSSAGACTHHLDRRDHASRPVQSLEVPTTDSWEEYVAQCRQLGQDVVQAGPDSASTQTSVQAECGPVEQAAAKAEEFSSSHELSSLPPVPATFAPASQEAADWPEAVRDAFPNLPARITREPAAFSAPVFPGEAHIQHKSSASHSGAFWCSRTCWLEVFTALI
jgi:hypothetical protein